MWRTTLSVLTATAILGCLLCVAAVRAQEGMGPPPGGDMGGPPHGGPMGGPMMGGPMMGGPGGPMGGGGPPPVPPPLMMALRTAGLTADQKKQIRDIIDSSRKSNMSQMQQMHSIREQIADKLLSSGPVSQADLAPLMAQQTALQQQLDSQMISTALKIRGVMTADQLSKVAAANEKLKQIRSQIDAILGPPDAPPAP